VRSCWIGFHKETFSGRLLSYYSNPPLCQKIGIIYNLIDRAILLFHPKHQQKNIELCIKYLLDNGYPLTLIFKKINKRLKGVIVIFRFLTKFLKKFMLFNDIVINNILILGENGKKKLFKLLIFT